MNTIMVQMADDQWTKEAMHLASALAISTNSRITLLQLLLVGQPGMLGSDFAPVYLDQQQIEEYTAIAEAYDVECHAQPMQFISLTDALAQAVELHNATALFAQIPESRVPFWRRIQRWNLTRQLGKCQLYTLDKAKLPGLDSKSRSLSAHIKSTG